MCIFLDVHAFRLPILHFLQVKNAVIFIEILSKPIILGPVESFHVELQKKKEVKKRRQLDKEQEIKEMRESERAELNQKTQSLLQIIYRDKS